ncbi:hypothetical protein JQ617_29265 [Bradyrhizobium sp. KB893862 SZCCT0404]|uniref:hypothetical protein n=1 Tax=Bradyrhizobium sp. KB893862 SZCCT0404 TaxID=2807672 RepID=UPI001BA72796|nr:hypothetical protein [Bradyrhizobium sp. KB893862 SZCCT0404]MBR1178082.1 hypothetical protein [Bradyrhizobium sp. KB893862 SZCCT0404]
MRRYATVTTVWLLPPLLFAANCALTAWRYGFHGIQATHMFALFAATFSLTGAVIAVRAQPGGRGLRMLRLVVIVLILSIPAAAFSVVHLRSVLPFSAAAWVTSAMFFWIASTPLWGAVLFYRPGARGASLRALATIVACVLPFWLATLPCFFGCTYGSPPNISSPTGGASF